MGSISRNARPLAVSPLLDIEGAAALLGVTPRQVRELWQQRRLAGRKVGRRVRFAEADLQEYIEHVKHPAIR